MKTPSISQNLPVVMTTPARTFRRAWGEVKFSVSSLNLSTTRRETASARTWNHTQTDACRNTTGRHVHTQTHKHELVSDMSAYKARLMLSSPGARCTCHSVCIQLQTRVRALKRQQVKLGWPPWGITNCLSSNAVCVWHDSYNLPSPSWQWSKKQAKTRARDVFQLFSHNFKPRSKLLEKLKWTSHIFCSWTVSSSRWLFIHC